MTMDVVSKSLIEAAETDIVGLIAEVNTDPLLHRVLLRLVEIVEAQSDQLKDLEDTVEQLHAAAGDLPGDNPPC